MKKRFGLIAIVLGVAVLFSSCELIGMAKAMKDLGDELTDYNKVYVTNQTGESITVVYEEDPTTVDEGQTAQTGTITLNSGASNKEFLATGGYFKLYVKNNGGDIRIMDEEYPSDNYHLIPAHNLVTITKKDGKYYYSSVGRG